MVFSSIQYIGNSKVFCIKKEDKTKTYHIYDIKEKKMIDLCYHSCSEFENGYSIVSIMKDDRLLYGVIDSNNDIVIPCIYDNVLLTKEGIFSKNNHSSYGDDNDTEYYSRYDSLMDALDGEPDAYWNID